MSHVDTTSPITHVSLCAGYGGIDLGLRRAIPALRTIAISEIEAFACANLVAKMEAGFLDPAPIWTDLKTFPWSEFRDRVDILSGGYPCQPFSAAGKRLGAEDPRHLWPHISAGIAVMRPAVCFFENVEGHISLGLSDVIEDLAGLGYRTTWGIFSASEVGAPHQRKRVFILAYRHGERGQLPDWWRVTAEQVPVGYGETWRDVADTGRNGRRQDKSRWQSQGRAAAEWDGQTVWPSRPGEQQFAWEPPRVVDSASTRQQAQRDESNGQWREDAVGEPSELGNAASQREGWNEDAQRQPGEGWDSFGDAGEAMGNAASEGPQERSSRSNDSSIQAAQCGSGGEGDGQTQPPLGRDADGPSDWLDHAELYTTCDNRTDELRLLGNGVVPATAERAFRVLVGELMEHQP